MIFYFLDGRVILMTFFCEVFYMICPVIKTREALYLGGFIPDNEDNNEGLVNIDGVDFYFDDAPRIMATSAFGITRNKTGSHEYEMPDEEPMVFDKLREIEARESIRELLKTGSSEYSIKGNIHDDIMKEEKEARNKLRGLVKKHKEN